MTLTSVEATPATIEATHRPSVTQASLPPPEGDAADRIPDAAWLRAVDDFVNAVMAKLEQRR
jgi:hypothetical protein